VSVRVEVPCPRHPESDSGTPIEADPPRAIASEFQCAFCGDRHALHADSITQSGGLTACVACAHPELYTQKDFPRGLGIAIVVLAALLAPFTMYISLVAAALIDAVLFKFARDVVVCYACRARHHHFTREPAHPRFDREIEERLKFGARAVMGKPMRPGGTADAPEPEH
jgi:hypothetical protein